MSKARDAARKAAYRRTFCGDGTKPHMDGERVLADLRKFAHVDIGGLVVSPVSKTTDPYATMYRAGLRDMYERIAAFVGASTVTRFPPIEELDDESAQT